MKAVKAVKRVLAEGLTSKQKHVELKNLSRNIKSTLFDMLKLASEMLGDHEYVDECGGQDKLLESLESEEFSHFGGSPSLAEMLRAYQKNQRRTTWQEYKFNIWAMIELSRPATEAAEKERVNWKSLAKDFEAKLARAEATIDQYRASDAEKSEKIASMATEIGELRGEMRALQRFAKVA